MFQDIGIEELADKRRQGDIALIDVRSPSEYRESTIPGSVNIPLFDDGERAEIGTLYTQVGIPAAKERGLEIVSAKLPAFIRRFAEIPGRKAVFCWRGGMRSKTSATVLSLMDIHVYRLSGGYRAYRKWVVETLESYEIRQPLYVLHGNTGTGKTEVLQALKRKGYPVIDLEDLAGHRGSIFGHIGRKSRNQKTFDSLLLDELIRYERSPYLIIEAESSRIGKVVMPEFLFRKKETGRHLWLEMPTEDRVRNILNDYRPSEYPQECLAAFRRIKQRIHTPIAAEIEGCLLTERYDKAVAMLLEYYYDPKYAHSSEGQEPDPGSVIRARGAEEAEEQLVRLLPDPGAAD
ncbi:tRNA 2-selenouridine(34) synthase MnmH [Cohnella caldifontis]|uniref:tRNA 2-selenouridine(34) synthase MnmH n=1 Tax=Cohnella caldifontis TaxID=3027471 RepID=UPI0023ED4EC9|nr:tRNA 2-selenouridine(34) synthase MnmH [Cohnella sp. YIM B05605]